MVRSSRTAAAVVAGFVLAALGLAAACSPFGSDEPQAPAPEGGGPTPPAGSGTSTRPATCRGGRDAGFFCGPAECTTKEICCPLVDGGVCVPSTARCPVDPTQECRSSHDCRSSNDECCIDRDGTDTTACHTSCNAPDLLACETDDECPSDQRCAPPDKAARTDLWHCAPCPP